MCSAVVRCAVVWCSVVWCGVVLGVVGSVGSPPENLMQAMINTRMRAMSDGLLDVRDAEFCDAICERLWWLLTCTRE